MISLVRDGVIDGIRIDHPDGLADPAGYLERLRSRGVERAWVEKILDESRAQRLARVDKSRNDNANGEPR